MHLLEVELDPAHRVIASHRIAAWRRLSRKPAISLRTMTGDWPTRRCRSAVRSVTSGAVQGAGETSTTGMT